ncbi:MAG TPA: SPOR domain-containing protein [Thermoanaerobaculia bacterium]|nr:SPOR domain-containing protein [Thermoanaerobaculia bacterium]
MKHTMVTFRLHRKGVILVAVGAVLVGVLLFAAGYLTALRRSRGVDAARAPQITASNKAEKDRKDDKDKKDAKKESPETPHISDEVFALRVGAFADEAEAKAFVEALTARGHQPVVVPVTTQNGVVLQTVLIGRYSSRDEASSAAAELKEKEELSSAVVPASRTAS